MFCTDFLGWTQKVPHRRHVSAKAGGRLSQKHVTVIHYIFQSQPNIGMTHDDLTVWSFYITPTSTFAFIRKTLILTFCFNVKFLKKIRAYSALTHGPPNPI